MYHPVSLQSPYDKYNIADVGDCPVNPADLNDSLIKIEEFYKKISLSKTIPISIGGDHLISLPILRGLKKKDQSVYFNLIPTQILGTHILVITSIPMEHL